MRRILLIPVALMMIGCDDAETTVVGGDRVELRVRAYRYDKQRIEVGRGRITFQLTNAGPEPTNFRVRRADKERDLVSILTLEPGQTGSARERLKPGEYVMYSSVGRHESLGEHGTLTVTRRPASPQPGPRTGTRPQPTPPSRPSRERRSP